MYRVVGTVWDVRCASLTLVAALKHEAAANISAALSAVTIREGRLHPSHLFLGTTARSTNIDHDTMPGKHSDSATSELCEKCKENISVLVVRAKPICQSVHS